MPIVVPNHHGYPRDAWNELGLSLVGATKGSSAPTLTAFGPTGTIKQLSFIVGNSVYLASVIPHTFRIGTDVHPFIYWTTDGTDSNTVKWEFTYTFAAKQGEVFPADVVITAESASGAAAWTYNESAFTELRGFDISTIISVELKRITNGGTNNTDTVFGLHLGLHYNTDQSGTPLVHDPHFPGILIEAGFLLLETGDRIILEDGSGFLELEG